jgi:hypothetical protein
LPQGCELLNNDARVRALQGGEVPVTEMLGTFALSVGAAVRGRSFATKNSSRS